MSDLELCYLPATEAIKRFKAKTLSPVELLAALITSVPVSWLAWCLLPGPLLGIWSLQGLKQRRSEV